MRSGTQIEIFELIQLIYSAGLNPDEWPKVIEYLGEAMPYVAASLHVCGLGDRLQVQGSSLANWDVDAIDIYARHYINISPWVDTHRRAQVGVPYNADETCPTSSFANTEFYNDWARPHKVGCGGTAVKLLDDGKCYVGLGFNYDERYTERVKAPLTRLLSDLVPHFNRAIEMNRQLARLEILSQSVEGILNSFARPAFLLSSDCRVIKMNRFAERVVQRNLLNLTRTGHLILDHPNETKRLRQVVQETALRHETSTSSVDGYLPLTISGVPGPHSIFVFPATAAPDRSILRVHGAQEAQAVLATVQMRQDIKRPVEDHLMEIFALTRAESRLVSALASGKRLSDYADEAHRSIHTVREQIKSAMAKTECRTQGELIQLVSRLLAPL